MLHIVLLISLNFCPSYERVYNFQFEFLLDVNQIPFPRSWIGIFVNIPITFTITKVWLPLYSPKYYGCPQQCLFVSLNVISLSGCSRKWKWYRLQLSNIVVIHHIILVQGFLPDFSLPMFFDYHISRNSEFPSGKAVLNKLTSPGGQEWAGETRKTYLGNGETFHV